jgi:hypothetical protein
MPALALVAEGQYDEDVLKALIQRVRKNLPGIHCRICRGSLRGRYVRCLKELRYEGNFEKALIVADAHGKDPKTLVDELGREIQNVQLPFPVHFVAIVQELEAWLLADHLALNSVMRGRGGGAGRQPVTDSPESSADPKTELRKLLGSGGVSYTPAVANEIARNADLERIGYWCPSFRRFEKAVNDP